MQSNRCNRLRMFNVYYGGLVRRFQAPDRLQVYVKTGIG